MLIAFCVEKHPFENIMDGFLEIKRLGGIKQEIVTSITTMDPFSENCMGEK